MSALTDFGRAGVQKDSEFYCPRCIARCTESPDGSHEYGHFNGCPRRPDGLPWVGSRSYDPAEDPLLIGAPDVAADGGRLECDDCGNEIDPQKHKILIRPNNPHLDLCVECQPHYRADRQYSPVDNGGEKA
ncbi:hypothetical protein [Halomicrobium salinisoli]|uniref:hypothetical protein n=1 Tax=Halomicrobium salinisoli TaxID=2878391 RepID=UPI001CEFB560|nr:hypothetical protein [Halomicrobium salinisoli]